MMKGSDPTLVRRLGPQAKAVKHGGSGARTSTPISRMSCFSSVPSIWIAVFLTPALSSRILQKPTGQLSVLRWWAAGGGRRTWSWPARGTA